MTANVNGVRAAARRGGLAWLADSDVDVIALQEVRASDEQLTAALTDAGLGHLHVSHAPASAAGRSGVAVLSKDPSSGVVVGVGHDQFADSGRWIEVTTQTEFGPVTVVSVYVHTGQADTPRQDEKHSFLDAMAARMGDLLAHASATGNHVAVCGDLNVARTEADIKNWRGNLGKAGFLESERAYLDQWDTDGWCDLARSYAGEVPGPYTWWSWRGKAFDTDAGWRIDYVWATPELAASLRSAEVGRAPSYAERWSDHAPLTVTFST